jgi:hypothetical protein
MGLPQALRTAAPFTRKAAGAIEERLLHVLDM